MYLKDFKKISEKNGGAGGNFNKKAKLLPVHFTSGGSSLQPPPGVNIFP